MKITGIICEYNPFHNGHKFHIEQTRKLCTSDYIIGIMSGPFTQRGTPAITDKYTRARIALAYGCDIIIELPVRYATASAEGFAQGAVNTLKATGVTDSICFGTEEGSLDYFNTLSDIIENEPASYKVLLANELKSGVSFPKARENALKSYMLQERIIDKSSADMSLPNNILAIEYLRACKKTGLTAYTVKRCDTGYHETSLPENDDIYCSASAIRNQINKSSVIPVSLDSYVPYDIFHFLSHPVTEDDFSMQLYTAIAQNITCLDTFADISSPLADRIKNSLSSYENWSRYVSLLKTKELTYTRIQRALCHCLLSIRETKHNSEYPAPYIRILGFRKNASKLVKHIRNNCDIPVVTKASNVHTLAGSFAGEMLAEDIYAAELYNKTFASKYSIYNKKNEYTHGLVIIE